MFSLNEKEILISVKNNLILKNFSIYNRKLFLLFGVINQFQSHFKNSKRIDKKILVIFDNFDLVSYLNSNLDKLLILFKKEDLLKVDEDELKIFIKNNLDKILQKNSLNDFAFDLLNIYKKKISSIDNNFNLMSLEDKLIFFNENFENFFLQSIEVKNNKNEIIQEIISVISNIKKQGYSLKNLDKINFENLDSKIDLMTIMSIYEKYKKKKNLIDEEDILLLVLDLLNSKEEIRNKIISEFSRILIFNFQNINRIEFDFFNLLIKNNIKFILFINNLNYIYQKKINAFDICKKIKDDLRIGGVDIDVISLNDFNLKENNYLKDLELILTRSNYLKNNLNFIDNKNIKFQGNFKEILSKNLLNPNIEVINFQKEEFQISYILEKLNTLVNEFRNNIKFTKGNLNFKKFKIGILSFDNGALNNLSKKLDEFNINHNFNLKYGFLNSEVFNEIYSILNVINNPKEANTSLFYLLSKMGIRNSTLRRISRKSSLLEKSIFKVLENNYVLYNFLVEEDDFKKDEILKNEQKEKKGNKLLSEFEDELVLINNFYLKLKRLIDLYSRKISLYSLIKNIYKEFNFYEKNILFEEVDKKVLSKNIFFLNDFLDFVFEYQNKYKKNNLDFFLNRLNIIKKNFYFINNFFQTTSIKKKGVVSNLNDNLNFNVPIEIELKNLNNLNLNEKEFDFIFFINMNENKKEIFNFGNNFRNKFSLENFDLVREFLFLNSIMNSRFGFKFFYLDNENNFRLQPIKFFESLDLNKFKVKKEIKNVFLRNNLGKNKLKTMKKIKKIIELLFQGEFKLVEKEIEEFKKLSENNLKDEKENLFELNDFNFEEDEFSLDIDMSNQIYSVSQLKTYQSCPKKYLFQYVYKIPTEPKYYFDFGTSIHEVLEHIIDEINPDIDKETLFIKAINLLHKVWISKGYENANQEREYFEKGTRIVREFIEKEIKLQEKSKFRKTIAKEKTFTIDLSGRKLYGIIDRIDLINEGEEKSYEILDYKTSNSCETIPQLNRSIQLYVYAMAVKDLYGVFPNEIGLWYLIFDKILKVKFDENRLENVKEEILKLIKDIERNNFKPNPSKFNCKNCDFNKICKNSLL